MHVLRKRTVPGAFSKDKNTKVDNLKEGWKVIRKASELQNFLKNRKRYLKAETGSKEKQK